jgi:hypothetical protein
MTQLKSGPTIDTNAEKSKGKGLYVLGGISAFTALLLVLVDIAISMGGGDFSPHTLTAIDWFKMYQENSLIGLRMLGLINVISLTVCIPLYFALYEAHRKVCGIYAALVLIMYLIGVAVYISNNAAIPMHVLSIKYAAASTEAQKALLAAAGEAITAKGADFTPGSFIGFFFTEAAGFGFSIIMLKGRIFSRAAACFGIVGFIFLTVFTIWTTFIPVYFNMAMMIAMVGGISGMAWYALTARDLLRLGAGSMAKQERRLS